MTDTDAGVNRGSGRVAGTFEALSQFGNTLRSDEALLRGYRQGDARAFEALYLRHKDNLFAFICRGCSRDAVAEELAHDTWLAVIAIGDGANEQNTQDFARRAKFKTWLFGIAQHKVADHWRRRAHRETHEDIDSIAEIDSIVEATANTTAPEASTGPETQRLWQEVLRLVRALPEEQGISFLLREEGFSHTEIAAMTGVGRETVKSRLRYATRGLQTLLEDKL